MRVILLCIILAAGCTETSQGGGGGSDKPLAKGSEPTSEQYLGGSGTGPGLPNKGEAVK